MITFLIFFCIILSCSLSFSFRLQSNFTIPSITAPIQKRGLTIGSQSSNIDQNSSLEDSEPIYSEEGWLMELNEKNVEGVLDLIRPQLSSDGGGINLSRIEDNQIFVKFTGSCIGCPYRSTTLKEVIENNLTKFLKSPNGSPICVKVIESDN
ncbi:NifU-like protein 2, chloroplast precursor [Theileria orientalis strain Shintoku]|uniref:NifU-like protein 2, chloroplast n=1 Tax=Theileria orientalis strain Shintoku TaxID=869250 RepID=J7M833_THEOR|nr:NifU-like protein 2, chloroplast precursor [Theileria orientalis strain Shintoku]PVC50318.1 NifU-like protein 2, chloroplast precursor [Theileria orientalis]BAM38588.1 NifU-like protein 2, chloroplast precursor [Theileria orientalis strain Shintoku]|eukprot:XP_009688889.1 NifU-like protein 2, chloroplast precursor [Theileria orientalis strain Shintoku]